MTDDRLPSMGNIRFRYYTPNAFANFYWPTVAEMNSAVNSLELEAVTDWDNFEIGVQASETGERVPIKAKAPVTRRADPNYGGTATFYRPGYYGDAQNLASLVWDRMRELNVEGYLALSVDGEIGEAGQPNENFQFAHGDYATLLRVVSDEWTDEIADSDDMRYTKNWLRNGGLAPYTVVSTGTPVITVLPATATVSTVAPITALTGRVNGREYTRGLRWVSGSPALASVSDSGIVRKVAGTGSATITATLPRSTATAATSTITVSA